jgi:urea transporter
MNLIDYSKSILKGFGQIMLQNNALSGLLFLVGIFYNSWLIGLGALLGIFASTLTAIFLNYGKQDIKNGIYGFNGALVGLALFYFFEFNWILAICTVVGAIISTIVFEIMIKKKLRPYTFPFVLSGWIVIYTIKYLKLISEKNIAYGNALNLDIFSSAATGFGQVMFQKSVITGIIFFIAIFINSRKAAIYAFFGSILGMSIAFAFSLPMNLINLGIFGYNAVLCGIVTSNGKKHAPFFALISILLSIAIIYGMISWGIIALTAPFVFAIWITNGLENFF